MSNLIDYEAENKPWAVTTFITDVFLGFVFQIKKNKVQINWQTSTLMKQLFFLQYFCCQQYGKKKNASTELESSNWS